MDDIDPSSTPANSFAPLSRWQRSGLFVLLLGFIAFGVIVEIRSAFMKRHMTDLGVYLRAAWAVRAGEDIYAITDDNSWHYHYPSLFAILLVPLADPPPGSDRDGMLPFGTSVAIWYVFSLICLAAAVHILASAIEQSSRDPAVRNLGRGCRRWWALRIVPILACLPMVGHTLMRGQVNLLLLLLLCGMIAAFLRGRSVTAGFWLAGAICLKIIPAFLLIYPLWRRDFRCLSGCVVGLFLGLVMIPMAVFGPVRTWQYYREWDDVLRKPALASGVDQSRAKELIEVTATDSQSFLAVIHNTVHFDRATRPKLPSRRVRAAHWLIGGALTALTLLALVRRPRDTVSTISMNLGSLILIMMLLSPVCHLHYFCLLIPLVMALLAKLWGRGAPMTMAWTGLLMATFLSQAIPHFPGMDATRDLGLVTYASLILWGCGLALVWTSERASAASSDREYWSSIAA